LRLPSRSARQRLLFGFAPIRGRSVASPRIAVRRTAVHLLARLAVATTCTSSAAAFDAIHISRMTCAIVSRSQLPELRLREAGPNHRPSFSAAADTPSSFTAGRGFLAYLQSASQVEVEIQSGEPEEIGKQ
jgi:hypothetical protein